MPLKAFAREMEQSSSDDGKGIDFGAAGLYLPGLQTITATVVTSAVSILACWLFPLGAISAVRTLALTATAGILIIRRPIKIGNTKGVNTIFSALRPCCLVYLFCLVLEQLVHTCVGEETTYEHGFWRRVVYHSMMSVMTVAAFLRAKSPRSETDVPFMMACVAMLVIALLPPPALALSGPLCSPPTLMGAGERIARAFMFSCTYVVLVYASAPIRNNLADAVVCIARSTAASSWILGAVIYTVPLAAAQVVIILYCSFQSTSTSLQYEDVRSDIESNNPLVERFNGISAASVAAAMASQSSEHQQRAASPTVSEMGSASVLDEHSACSSFSLAPQRRQQAACFQPLNGGGLTFSLSIPSASPVPQLSQQRLEEIASGL